MQLDRDLELNWREVTCKRSVAGDSFPQGVQDYDFSVSGKNAWIPGYSYFKVDLKLTKKTAGANERPPVVRDGIAFADGLPGCLYNNCYFRAGGQDVSSITQYVPQAHILKCRLDRSAAWMKNTGQDATYCDADFNRRINKISSDGKYRNNGVLDNKNSLDAFNRPLLSAAGLAVGGTATFDGATGLLTTANMDFIVTGVREGDLIQIGAGPFQQVLAIVDAVTLRVTDGPAVGAPAAITAITTVKTPNTGQNTISVNFQPPIGIFDVYDGLGSGDFKLQLNPNADYKSALVQSVDALVREQGYDVKISNVRLYVCQIKKDMPPSGTLPLSLMEMQIINKAIPRGPGQTQLDFTVPPSTLALTVFVQTGKAGTDSRNPPTVFLDELDAAAVDPLQKYGAKNLENIQVTYGSVTKPATLYSSSFDKNVNNMVQRWVSSQYHAAKYNNEGGTESFEEFMERGPYYHFDFSRDKNDSSSYVNVSIKYGQALSENSQLFIVAHYSRQISIEYESGFITQVISVNR